MDLERLENACARVLKKMDSGFSAESEDPLLRQAIACEAEELHPRLWQEFTGLGPLVSLIEDRSLKEILVNGHESLWIERQNGLELFHDRFLSEVTLQNFVHRLSAECAFNVNLQFPFGDADWRGFRAHLIRPPLSEGWRLSLRGRPPAPWTLNRLMATGWASSESVRVLREWLKERRNFLIIGPTGSGKTSVLNACLQEFDSSERVICLEDTPELTPKPGASCKLRTRTDGSGQLLQCDLGDLLRQSLRMRPERLVVGEVRGGEAKDLLLALATGHRGSMGTLHASDPRQALLRLEMLVQMGARQWDSQAIRQLIQLSLDGLVVVGNENGQRTLEGIYRLASLESIGFLLDRVA